MHEYPSLFFLFKSFLKIGLTSFGGHAALVSVLQEELVNKKKVLTEEIILDGMSIASFLPGPLAVNVATYIGYKLGGWFGAMVSMVAVLLPPFVLMIFIAKMYGMYSDLDPVNSFLAGVIPVIIALILSLCFNMFRKNVKKSWQYVLFGTIVIAAIFLNSYLWIVIFIVFGGIIGYFLNHDNKDSTGVETKRVLKYNSRHLYSGILVVVITFGTLFYFLEGVQHQLLFLS